MATPNEINSNFNQIAISDSGGNVLGVNIGNIDNFKVAGGPLGSTLVSSGVGGNLVWEQVELTETIMIPETSWGFCRVLAYGNQVWRAGTRIGAWGVVAGAPSNSLEIFFDRGGPAAITKMALCNTDLLLLGSDGKMYGFGDGRWGEFGNNSTTNNPFRYLTAATSPKLTGPGITVLNFWITNNQNSGDPDTPSPTIYTHLNDNGTLKTYAYGAKRSSNNMTGSNTNPDPTTDPFEITQLAGKSIVDGYVSSSTAMFVTSTGEVWGIGYNADGGLGIGTFTPPNQFTQATLVNGSPVTGAAKVVIAWAEGQGVSSYILLSNGQVLAAGFGANGRLGNGSPSGSVNRFAPVQTAAGVNLQNIVKIQPFIGGLGALDNAGNVWFVGRNWDGCWGNGAAANTDNVYASIKQTGIGNFWIRGGAAYGYVAAFYLDAVAVNGHRQLWAAGHNTDYQLGVGPNVPETVQTTRQQVPLPRGEYPVQIGFLGGVTGAAYLGHQMVTNNNRYYVVGSPGSDVTAVIGVSSLNAFHAISDFKK